MKDKIKNQRESEGKTESRKRELNQILTIPNSLVWNRLQIWD